MSQEIISTKNVLSIVKVFMGILLSVIFYILVIVGISRLCDEVYDFSYQLFGNVRAQEAPGFDVDFVIADKEPTMQVAARLEHNKLIVNKYSFYIRAQLAASGKGGSHIQPGEYELNTSMTYEDILNIITVGEKPEESPAAKEN